MGLTRRMKALLGRVQDPVKKSPQSTKKHSESVTDNGRLKIHKSRKLPPDWFFKAEYDDHSRGRKR